MTRNSIKNKFTIGFLIIFLASNILLNLAVRQSIENNRINEIQKSMNTLLNSSREFIKGTLNLERGELTASALQKSAYNLAVKLSILNNSYVGIRDNNGKIIEEINTNIPVEAVMNKKDVAYTLQNKSYYYVSEADGRTILSFSYPLYFENRFIGIISFRQDYTENYKRDQALIDRITMIQIIALLLSIIFSFFLINKLTKPLKLLTLGIENMRKGLYEGEISVNSSDEIGTLAAIFNKMRAEIREYIINIQNEKDKVLKMENARKEFFDNITHELKTPLTGISAYAQILSSGLEDEEFRQRASERILEESNRLHELVLDLIEVSKGKTEIEEESIEVNLAELIGKVMIDLGKKAENYRIQIQSDIKGYKLNGKKHKLEQLFINLLDNAIKYSVKNSKVLITGYQKEGETCVIIENRAEQKEIFATEDLFVPFTKRSNKEYGSRGLGLSICKNIMEMHNGEIQIEWKDFKVKTILRFSANKNFTGNNLETT